MQDILEFFGVAGPTLTGVVFGGAVLALFWKGDDAISQQARQSLSSWLQGLSIPGGPPSWPHTFINMFDRIFGPMHAPRAMLVSVVTSFAGVIVMLMVWGAFRPADFAAFLSGPEWVFIVFWLVLGINSGVDYVSLLETRIILDLIDGSCSLARIVGWMMFDAIATVLIFFMGTALMLIPNVFGTPHVADLFDLPFDMTIDWYLKLLADSWMLLPDSQTHFSYGVLLYTTFFTSFWIWIYVATRSLVRVLAAFSPTLRFLQWTLPIRSKPMRSIGIAAGVASCFGYWIFAWIIGVHTAAAVLPPATP